MAFIVPETVALDATMAPVESTLKGALDGEEDPAHILIPAEAPIPTEPLSIERAVEEMSQDAIWPPVEYIPPIESTLNGALPGTEEPDQSLHVPEEASPVLPAVSCVGEITQPPTCPAVLAVR
ncbi:MAG: hypothetical protein QW842_07130 [Candidatus Nezhaarchaeales archaeon]